MSSHNLVFLHGWGTDSSVWKHQAEYFSKRHNVYTPDFDLLHAPRSTLHAVLIGWSYGGMLAIEIAAKEPAGCKAMILVGCSAKFTDGLSPIIIKNIRRKLDTDFDGTMKNCYGTFFITDEAAFMNEFIEKQMLPQKTSAIRMLDRLLFMDLRGLLKNVNVPTLIIHGDKDTVCPVSGGIYLHENIKGSKIKIIKDAGHMPFYTRAEGFNRILEEFIGTLD